MGDEGPVNDQLRSKRVAMLVTRKTSSCPDDYTKRLTDEYKILQDKIDKIGGF